MALLPVLFLVMVLLPSLPAEGKVRLKWKIFSELSSNFVVWQAILKVKEGKRVWYVRVSTGSLRVLRPLNTIIQMKGQGYALCVLHVYASHQSHVTTEHMK